MSGCHSKNSKWMLSPLKSLLGKIWDRYQAYHTAYKTHATATHHRGAGCPVDRDIDLHIEETEGINTGPDSDNESTSGTDTTIVFGGSEADGHPNELIPSNQTNVTALMREINDLHQWVEAREGQPAKCLDHIEWELQNISLTLQSQPSSTPTPTEPFGEVIPYYKKIRRIVNGYKDSSRSH